MSSTDIDSIADKIRKSVRKGRGWWALQLLRQYVDLADVYRCLLMLTENREMVLFTISGFFLSLTSTVVFCLAVQIYARVATEQFM